MIPTAGWLPLVVAISVEILRFHLSKQLVMLGGIEMVTGNSCQPKTHPTPAGRVEPTERFYQTSLFRSWVTTHSPYVSTVAPLRRVFPHTKPHCNSTTCSAWCNQIDNQSEIAHQWWRQGSPNRLNDLIRCFCPPRASEREWPCPSVRGCALCIWVCYAGALFNCWPQNHRCDIAPTVLHIFIPSTFEQKPPQIGLDSNLAFSRLFAVGIRPSFWTIDPIFTKQRLSLQQQQKNDGHLGGEVFFFSGHQKKTAEETNLGSSILSGKKHPIFWGGSWLCDPPMFLNP